MIADDAGSIVVRTLEAADTVLATMARSDRLALGHRTSSPRRSPRSAKAPCSRRWACHSRNRSIRRSSCSAPRRSRSCSRTWCWCRPTTASSSPSCTTGGNRRPSCCSCMATRRAPRRVPRSFEQALAEGVNTTTMEPLSDVFPGASVSTDGAVVVVTLPSEGAYRIAQRMLFERALFPGSADRRSRAGGSPARRRRCRPRRRARGWRRRRAGRTSRGRRPGRSGR